MRLAHYYIPQFSTNGKPLRQCRKCEEWKEYPESFAPLDLHPKIKRTGRKLICIDCDSLPIDKVLEHEHRKGFRI